MDGVRSTPALGSRQLTLGIGVCENPTRLEGIGNDVGPTVTTGGRCGNPAASGNIRDVAADIQGVGLSSPGLEETIGLPVSENPGKWPTPRPLRLMAERQLVNRGQGKKAGDIASGATLGRSQAQVLRNRCT